MRQALFVIYINVATLCFLLLTIEITGQFVYYAVKGYRVDQSPYRQKHYKIFEEHPYLVGRLRAARETEERGKTISATRHHTRWTGAQHEEHALIPVAVLGGSTTFGTGVSDEDSWPALLQVHLGGEYAVWNFGMPGYSTAENVIQMALLVPEVKPRVIMFYEGWNDIRSYHFKGKQPDYFDHGMSQFANLGIPRNSAERPYIERLAQVSVLAKAGLVANQALRGSHTSATAESDLHAEPDEFIDRIYRRNLNSLKVLAKESGARVMMLPQVLNVEVYAGMKGSRPWTPFIRDEALPRLLARFNETMEDVCQFPDEACLYVPEILEAPWTSDDFVDEGHFSKRGGEKLVEIVGPKVVALSQVSRQ